MAYDRDSFLAGLAVGRTLWRPHRDYGEVPEPWGWDVIEHSTGMIQRWEYSGHPDVDTWFDKGSTNAYWAWVSNSSLPSGYYMQSAASANIVGMFDVPVPARFNRLLVDVSVTGGGGYNVSSIALCDQYRIYGVYNTTEFGGNDLRRCHFTDYSETVEELNNQPFVTMNTSSISSLSRQTVVIDISEIDEPLYVGLHKCDSNVTIYSIRAF